MEKELENLKTVVRTEIAERIKVALGFGDLSENSEYDEAKNAQASNEIRIAELENKLRYARIIDDSEIDTKTVQLGNKVKVLDIEFDEELEYTIVGSMEVDLSQNKISNESPVGKSTFRCKKGQTIEVHIEHSNEVCKYKVLDIKRADYRDQRDQRDQRGHSIFGPFWTKKGHSISRLLKNYCLYKSRVHNPT